MYNRMSRADGVCYRAGEIGMRGRLFIDVTLIAVRAHMWNSACKSDVIDVRGVAL